MNSTSPVTIQDEITRLRVEVEEAKERGEFEYAFLLLDKIATLEENGTTRTEE